MMVFVTLSDVARRLKLPGQSYREASKVGDHNILTEARLLSSRTDTRHDRILEGLGRVDDKLDTMP